MTVNIGDLKFTYKFKDEHLIPAVIHNSENKEVSTLFYMNLDAVKKTQETDYVWRYSREHEKLMMKGATSGNRMKVVGIITNCNYDSLSVEVIPEGPACHLGYDSCFFRKLK